MEKEWEYASCAPTEPQTVYSESFVAELSIVKSLKSYRVLWAWRTLLGYSGWNQGADPTLK